MNGVKACCPNCGVEFLLIPQVASTQHLEGNRLSFFWFPTEFEHRCQR